MAHNPLCFFSNFCVFRLNHELCNAVRYAFFVRDSDPFPSSKKQYFIIKYFHPNHVATNKRNLAVGFSLFSVNKTSTPNPLKIQLQKRFQPR